MRNNTPIWMKRRGAKYTDTGPKMSGLVVRGDLDYEASVIDTHDWAAPDTHCKCGYHVCSEQGVCAPVEKSQISLTVQTGVAVREATQRSLAHAALDFVRRSETLVQPPSVVNPDSAPKVPDAEWVPKVGDRVKHKKGELATLVLQRASVDAWDVRYDVGFTVQVCTLTLVNMFKPWVEDGEHKFKVGDEVTLKEHCRHRAAAHATGIVSMIDPRDDDLPFLIVFSDGHEGWWGPRHIEGSNA